MNDALKRLAAAAGIELEYWDGLGVRRELQEPTARALLAALGCAPDGDADAQAGLLADRAFAEIVAPALVVRRGAPPVVGIAVPQTDLHTPLEWTITLEAGTTRSGASALEPLDSTSTREIGGTRYVRCRLTLPDDLPLGYHRLHLPRYGKSALLVASPARCYVPPALIDGQRRWGLAVQLYALRSARNWGIGDFSDLAALVVEAQRIGAAFVGLNPLHARHLCFPDEASPYAPSSREFLDPVYIDVEAVPEYAACRKARAVTTAPDFIARVQSVRAAPLVDYAGVTTLKLDVLAQLFRHFLVHDVAHGTPRAAEFRAFRESGGASLAHFAAFEARRLHGEPVAEHVEFQIYLQWLASTQLAAAARAAALPIGLYRDLAVGATHGGAECTAEPGLFAASMSLGAPPDLLNREGQNWGLAPFHPHGLAAHEYLPLRRLLAANMREAGALRIDHVMALTRLFWIPQGMSGAAGGYVRYAFDTLAAIIALESERNRCLVIGEDLGSVPDGLRETLRERGFLSYRVMIYERHWNGDGSFCRPDEYPAQALGMVATHDMPMLHDYWHSGDIQRRAALGLYPDERQRDEEFARRRAERDGLLKLLGDIGLTQFEPDNAARVVAGLHGAIARSRAMLAAVQLDDVIGETEPVNIPGTYREYPNWRRKLGLSLEEIFADARWTALAAIMRAGGRC